MDVELVTEGTSDDEGYRIDENNEVIFLSNSFSSPEAVKLVTQFSSSYCSEPKKIDLGSKTLII